ncbi:MAG: cob(I)yrinic acid a,c-diamide adenosyltransferase [Desulfuromonas sp.]|nr:MAG: cob(I)yrinic acid a,c-diamide adenosyltransferase [Desulfuromonas sp.]
MQKGLVHIYTGNGKGKTTAATGVIVRALGQGQKVLLARFLKPDKPESGEIKLLSQQPNMTILTAGIGIIGKMPEKEIIVKSVNETFAEAKELVLSGAYDLAVFDEINNSMHNGYIEIAAIRKLIEERPEPMNLILTGRNAPDEIRDLADLVTSMEKVKHPYDAGIPARKGLEF